MNGRITGIITVLMVLGSSVMLRAGGFQNPGPGAAAAGQASAFVAQADDATAISYNPAGLTQIKGKTFLFSPTFVHPSTKYTPAAGAPEEIKDQVHFLPNLYFTAAPADQRWCFGLGITTPFGQSSEWSKTGYFKYFATFSEMRLVDVNPAVAFSLNPKLSVGLGLDYYQSALTLESQDYYGPPLGPPGTPDGSHKITADGGAWGYNLGVLLKPSEKHSVGAAFRSGVSVDHEGHAVFSAPGGGLAGSSPVSIKVDFPASASFGYAYQPNKKWKLECDVEWVEWSSVKNTLLDFALLSPQGIARNWKDTWSYRLGAEFRPAPAWKCWAGYLFLPSPVPDATFTPENPDSDTNIFCFGVGWTKKNLTLALTQELSFPKDRRINRDSIPVGAVNVDVNGTYESFNHISILTLQYGF